MRDEVSKLEAEYVGEVCRMEIPLQSVANLARVAEVLRGLASRFDNLYHYPHETPAGTMLEVRRLIGKANRDLMKVRGRGRPRKRVHSLRWVR